jgi:hypothetical protein
MANHDKLFKLANYFESLAQAQPIKTFHSTINYTSLYDTILVLLKNSGIPQNYKDIVSFVNQNEEILKKYSKYSWIESDYYPNYGLASIGRQGTKLIQATLSIKKDPPSDDFELKEQFFLKGAGTVPNFYISIGYEISLTKEVPKQMAHEAWLVYSLHKLFAFNDTSLISNFFEQNKDKINKIRNMFSVGNQVALGEGQDGIGFDIGGNKVLKLFRSTSLFNKTKESLSALYKYPVIAKTEAMIYDVGILGQFEEFNGNKHNVYYSVIQKMEKLPEDIYFRTSIYAIASYIRNQEYKPVFDKLKLLIKEKENHQAVKGIISNLVSKLVENIKQDLKKDVDQIEFSIKDLDHKWLDDYVEEVVVKIITDRYDLHPGNMGLINYYDPASKGYTLKFRYFDPFYGGGK